MKYDAHDSSAFVATSTSRCFQYSSTSTLSYAASSSSVSLWSDAASFASDDSSILANTSDSDLCDSFLLSKRASATAQYAVNSESGHSLQQRDHEVLPAELRQNPRRSAPSSHPGRACPPSLVRQSDRKLDFVDGLVDTSTQIVMAFWPLSSTVCQTEPDGRTVLPLRTFIQETLRRSRTSYSTLQVALYYLVLIRARVPNHSSTSEQEPDETHRALQCGRRMFLAALILASKYLQDRNYSARAWSKISGLVTQEINQNELTFLFAVNWELHITEDAFQKFSRLVHRSRIFPQVFTDWKELALKLESKKTGHDGLISLASANASARSILNCVQERRSSITSDAVMVPSLSTVGTAPLVLEPVPTSVCPSGHLAPSLGLLPTPRLTPPSPRLTPGSAGSYTPAVSAVSHLLGKTNAMGLAMAQASSVGITQTTLDRFPCSVGSSPSSYCPARRSSLVKSVSASSSPESMVTDSSRSSRSSSISSASSLASATLYNNRCSLPLRSRGSKLGNDRASAKPSFPSVPEDLDENCLSSSPPDMYTGPDTKLGDMSLNTPPVTRGLSVRDMVCDPASDAARALQDLHKQDLSADTTPTAMKSRKRNRASSIETHNSLPHEDVGVDNVREMMSRHYTSAAPTRPSTTVARPQGMGIGPEGYLCTPKHAAFAHPVKRVCCSTEAANGYQTAAGVHHAMGLGSRGMWNSILN
ncbi:hypothetical protein E4U17_001728 [Claviceps sp. LM77 group G4]|nr:hypothetical protein E4U17_001728 [Claviceps sp. LM77 group G4]KAG6065207.1 hypothetical protein E4U33_005930 [Claviceps sp. LM78 group G4]KAG6074297.1 hypothetical protein E4U16_004041 [Claviceps sp. LM84 group G4]